MKDKMKPKLQIEGLKMSSPVLHPQRRSPQMVQYEITGFFFTQLRQNLNADRSRWAENAFEIRIKYGIDCGLDCGRFSGAVD